MPEDGLSSPLPPTHRPMGTEGLWGLNPPSIALPPPRCLPFPSPDTPSGHPRASPQSS